MSQVTEQVPKINAMFNKMAIRAIFLSVVGAVSATVGGFEGQTMPPATGKHVAELLKEARSHAGQDRKVLVVIGASWCNPCKKLHKILTEGDFAAILKKHFVLAFINANEDAAHRSLESPDVLDWCGKWSLKLQLPCYVVVGDESDQIRSSSHMSSSEGMSDFGLPVGLAQWLRFLTMLSESDPRITESDLWKMRHALDRYTNEHWKQGSGAPKLQ